jgi:hypothetical protein
MAMSDFDRVFDGASLRFSKIQSQFSDIQSDFDRVSSDLNRVLIDIDSLIEVDRLTEEIYYTSKSDTKESVNKTKSNKTDIPFWEIVKLPDNKTYIYGTMGTKKVRIPLSTLQNLTDDQIENMITDYFNGNTKKFDIPEMEEDPEVVQETEETKEPEEQKPVRNVIPLGSPTPKEGKYPVKWVNGNIYKLRVRGRFGIRGYERRYVLKKFIYNVKNVPVNVVIMKQLSGPRSTTFTLSKSDCVRFHIKYEDGLQVMSMAMNWIPSNDTSTNNAS